MAKIGRFIILLLVISFTSFIVYKVCKTYSTKKKAEMGTKELPHVSFIDLSNKSIFIDDFVQRKPTVIIYYHSDCEHCQYEAEELRKNSIRLNNTQILMVSGEPLDTIRKFGKRFGVDTLNFITLFHCDYQVFFNTFGTANIPSIFIYSSDRKLLKQYNGEAKLDAITKYLK